MNPQIANPPFDVLLQFLMFLWIQSC